MAILGIGDWGSGARAYEGVSVVTCPVDYSENIQLTDRLGELTDPI